MRRGSQLAYFLIQLISGENFKVLQVVRTVASGSKFYQLLPAKENTACVITGNFALSFSLKFLSIFVHISGSTETITLIWYHYKDLFLLQKLSIHCR